MCYKITPVLLQEQWTKMTHSGWLENNGSGSTWLLWVVKDNNNRQNCCTLLGWRTMGVAALGCYG